MGTSEELQRWQRLLLSIVVIVLMVTGLVTYSLIQQLRVANQAVTYSHAERVIDADGAEIALFARSANARGYLLSGDRLFLENRTAARTELGRRLGNLRARNRDNPALDEVDQLLQRLDTASDRAIATYERSQDDATTIWENEARPIQDQLAKQVGQVVALEHSSFATARDQAAAAWRRSAILLAVLLGGLRCS